MELNILRADPAGNITIFVLDRVEKARRAEIAAKLMAKKELGAEQVAFVCEPVSLGSAGRIEMMGNEFCGNALRAFGLYLAAQRQESVSRLSVEISGCKSPATVTADTQNGISEAQMPLPRDISPFIFSGVECIRVDFDGISHLVADCPVPNQRVLGAAKALFADDKSISAFGIMYLDRYSMKMTPLVYVKATDSLVWESSCGSGTVAAAITMASGLRNGEKSYTFAQPCGSITAKITKRNGEFAEAVISGEISLGKPFICEI